MIVGLTLGATHRLPQVQRTWGTRKSYPTADTAVAPGTKGF